MNDNIELNHLYSYKELCSLLGEESKSGKARNLQFNKWLESYDISKPERGKYLISRIRSKEEVQYIDDLKNYSKYLTNLFIDRLLEEKGNQACYTYRELREMLGMVNEDYFPVKYKKKDISIKIPSNSLDVNIDGVRDKWIGISDIMDEQTLNYVLEKLEKQALINYRFTYKFYKFEVDENGNTIYNPPHVATSKEESLMLEAQKEGLLKAGLENKQQLFFATKAQREVYYGVVNNFIQGLGYNRYGRAVVITIVNNLWKFAEVSKPRFNQLQVERYLNSKRFKMIPPFVNEQLVDGLIKIE